ncbi:MAG: hypothetical protein AB3X44_20875 [Leptothrix sp. (in: b-proteobacteria)]
MDSFQTVTSFRWDDLNQFWAIVVGAFVLYLAQWLTGKVEFFSLGHLHAIAYSLLGGVLAPVAKDLITSLSTIKLGK